MVVVAGFGKEPLMLLTTEEMENKRQRLWWVIEAYLTRWRIEETIRFVKQSYQVEDIRVLTYERLRNMMGLVLAASYFAAVYLGVRAKMEILVTHVLKASKRIFGIPDFRYYAIADGIRELLHRYNRRMVKPIKALINENQLPLFDS
jgi:Transposase DDE domain